MRVLAFRSACLGLFLLWFFEWFKLKRGSSSLLINNQLPHNSIRLFPTQTVIKRFHLLFLFISFLNFFEIFDKESFAGSIIPDDKDTFLQVFSIPFILCITNLVVEQSIWVFDPCFGDKFQFCYFLLARALLSGVDIVSLDFSFGRGSKLGVGWVVRVH